jgi:hypothetical protein
MGLKVIGSGFGRTGTMSLKRALEQLAFGPCHHMEEILAHPEQVPHWQAVVAGQAVNWDEVFAGYRSQVDWPGAHVWQELAAAYPQAKVIHTVRPEEQWWKSFSQTIGTLHDSPPLCEALPGPSGQPSSSHRGRVASTWKGTYGLNRDQSFQLMTTRRSDGSRPPIPGDCDHLWTGRRCPAP